MKEQVSLEKTIFSRYISRRRLVIGGTKGFTGLALGVILGIDKDLEFLPESLSFQKLERLSLKLLQQANQEQQNNRPELAEGVLDREFAFQVGELINQFRLENNLHPLVRHPALTAAAEGYAKFIIDNRLLGSLSHSLDGRTADERAKAQGYTGIAVGETITSQQRYPERAVEAWKYSPGHRAQLLSYMDKDLGVGRYEGANDYPYNVCVADFGIPRQSLPIEFSLGPGYPHVLYVWNFDNQTQRWSWYLYGLPTEKNTLTRFEKDKIYFAYSRLSTSLSSDLPNVIVKVGWNTFVWPGP